MAISKYQYTNLVYTDFDKWQSTVLLAQCWEHFSMVWNLYL